MKIKSQLIGIKTVDGQSSTDDAEEENEIKYLKESLVKLQMKKSNVEVISIYVNITS